MSSRPLPDARRCQEWAEEMLSYAQNAGAEGAEVLVRDGSELEVKVRLGEPELVKQAGSRGLGLRVRRDHRSAVSYTSDFAPVALREFARETVELCGLAEPDPLADLPERHEMARDIPDLDLWDEAALSLDVAQALRLAKQGEQAALQVDRRVTNSEGASMSCVIGASALASSAGFSGGYRGTSLGLVVEPVCDDADGKKRSGAYWTASRFVSGLLEAEAVGLEAARRTLAKLGSRKIATCQVPAVFAPEAARTLVGQLASVGFGGRGLA
jgi:PmbA protein